MSDLGWELCSLQTSELPAASTAPSTPVKPAAGGYGHGGAETAVDGSLYADEPARVIALIHRHRFESALRELRALPPSLPQLPWLMGQLVLALAQVGKHEDTAELASEMLARFPLRPEVTRTLVALAAILAVQGRVRQVFHPLGEAVVHTYEFSSAALLEWAQRLAYQFRRQGNPEAAASILGALEKVAMA